MSRLPITLCLVLGWGCGSDAPADVDGGSGDADAGLEVDAPSNELFSISGACGVLDDELTDDVPSDFDNVLTFHRAYDEDEEAALSDGGREIIADGNAGGSSIVSEIFAYEVLNACEMATLIKTENEIVYNGQSKKTDFLSEMDGVRIGVSVTRAQTFPLGDDLTIAAARALLDDKLADILESTANVSAADAWEKQVLAVLVYNNQHLASLETALGQVDVGLRDDTIVWMTVTDGPDDAIYE